MQLRALSAVILGISAVLGLHFATTSAEAPAPPGTRLQVDEAGASALLDGGARASFFRPMPTENWMGAGAESRNKKKRKAWMKEIHRTPPDLDYKRIEEINGMAQVEKRNTIARMRAERVAVPRTGVWSERGSSNQAGRMHVALRSADEATLWAGSAKGGIWRRPVDSTSSAWTAIGDNLYGGAHHLLVLPADAGSPDIVIAGTDGGLLHRSTDDGASWSEPGGLPARWGIRRMIATGGGVFVLLREANWEGYGLYRSTDDGLSFSPVRDLGDYFGDLWSPRTGSDDLYLLQDDEILLSTDDGDTWAAVGTDLGGGTHEGGELTGSEAGAPTLYAVLKANDEHTLHRSDDAGATWTEKHDVTDYWSTLNASMIDPGLFAWGGVEVHRTTDGGESFSLVNSWGEYYEDPATKLHADTPGLDVVADGAGGEVWYIATDGGLYHSTDGLASVENLSLDGLRVSQYYSTLTSTANPNHIAAGAQDQGYQLSYVADEGLVQFDQIISGDYGHLTSGDGTHAFVFSCYPTFVLAQIGEDSPQLGYIDFPADEHQAWLPPLTADPENRENFFFAASHLYYYTRTPDTYEWTYEQWSTQNFAEEEGEYISAVTFSPLNPDRAYLSTNLGRLFHSDDKGVSWTRATGDGPHAHYFYGNAMVASRLDVDTVYVGGSGYDGPPVWRSTDGGVTWTDWGEGLPATLVYDLTEADGEGGEVFAGTETAAFRRNRTGDAWEDITGAEAPVTIYWSVEPLLGVPKVRFGTYGRGIWDFEFDPACSPGVDADNDSYECDVDCDDDDPAIHPGATEVCDGVDADCDPDFPDEDDGDGDGFFGCAGDCDDERASVNPDREETCDGRDEDCDGLIDNDPVDPEVFHLDSDGDGFGDPEAVVRACEPPPGAVANVDDCNDDDPDIHPDAAEVCGDGRDNDCEGGDVECSSAAGGDGCEDCGASVAGSGSGVLLLLVPAAARRRKR